MYGGGVMRSLKAEMENRLTSRSRNTPGWSSQVYIPEPVGGVIGAASCPVPGSLFFGYLKILIVA